MQIKWSEKKPEPGLRAEWHLVEGDWHLVDLDWGSETCPGN